MYGGECKKVERWNSKKTFELNGNAIVLQAKKPNMKVRLFSLNSVGIPLSLLLKLLKHRAFCQSLHI